MASHSAALISRSIQHLLRRHAAADAPALSALAGKLVVGRPLPVNPTAQDPVSAGGAANLGLSGRSLDMALFGRVDWPAKEASVQVSILTKNSDDDEDLSEDFDSDEFDDDEDFSDDFVDADEDDIEETKPTKSKRS